MNDLAGVLHLRPGQPVPGSLRSTRRAWAESLAPGRNADALPDLLAGLFSLCGHAHRTACQLALHAADPDRRMPPSGVAAGLRRETAREHVRRIALDWPRQANGMAIGADASLAALDSLRDCPLLGPAASASPWTAALAWLESRWLHMSAQAWWQAWQDQGRRWVAAWAQRDPGWLAALILAARAADLPLPLAQGAWLDLAGQDDGLRRLGGQLAAQDGFSLRPRWKGRVACTGPWARLQAQGGDRCQGSWDAVAGRLVELVHLCLAGAQGEADDACPWPFGALNTGQHMGLGWVETARGVLIHQVALAPGDAHACQVHACQVLAPTEWNFHPEGIVAQGVSALRGDAPDLQPRLAWLMAAFDPCVPCRIEPTVETATEDHHA